MSAKWLEQVDQALMPLQPLRAAVQNPYRVRVKPWEPDEFMSSPYCEYRAGQVGRVIAEGWALALVEFDDGRRCSITFHSLELVDDET